MYAPVEKKMACRQGKGGLFLFNLLAHSLPLPWALTQEEGLDEELKAGQSHGGGCRGAALSVLAAAEALAGVEVLALFVSECRENAIASTVR